MSATMQQPAAKQAAGESEELTRLRAETSRLRNFALVFLVVDLALAAGWLLLNVHARFVAG